MMVLDCVCVEQLASVVRIISSVLEPYGEISLVQTLAHEFWVASYSGHSQCGDIFIGPRNFLPYGGFTSVTLVLWAAFPVQRFTREGQHRATVQK